ncbi:MAG: cyclase family protein [Acidobacteriota bacterium]|nr:cyclase family protein [Acidobacteriota bacterium]
MNYSLPNLHALLVALTIFLASSVGACAPTAEPPVSLKLEEIANELLMPGEAKLIDLTYPLSPDSLYWPTGSRFEHQQLDWGMSEGGYWYASAAFSSPEHLGTHLDAPIHFGENGWANADIPIERLFAHGVVIDITSKSNASADVTLSVDDIEAWEQRNNTLQEGSIVIVRTGWASGWPDWETYYGSSTPTDVATFHFPGISPEAAQALVNRGIFGVGIDTASIDPGNSSTFEAHQILAAANVFNLENLTNVDGLPEAGFDIIALPMKIKDGTGGPARVVAIVSQR